MRTLWPFRSGGVAGASSGVNGAVLTSAQTLDAAQQAQARTNIGAAPSIVPAFYAELAASTPVTMDGVDRRFHDASYLQTERYDTAGNFDPATSVFTVSEAGWYRFRGMVNFNSGWTGYGIIWVFKNGADTYPTNFFALIQASFSGAVYPPGERIIYGAVGDTFDLGYEMNGASNTTGSGAPGTWYSSWWSAEKM